MARPVTLFDLTTRIRQAADIENDTHVTDTEIRGLINTYYPWFWDILVEDAPPDYFLTSVNFTSVPGQTDYAINTIAPAGDFYKLRGIYVVDTDGRKRAIKPVQNAELSKYKAPTAAVNLTMEYIPSATVFNSDASVDGTFDGVNGWEELLVQRIAAAIRRKRDEDEAPHLREVSELELRIRKLNNRDDGEPQRVIRRRYVDFYPYSGQTYDIRGYRVAGNNLKLYSYMSLWYV